jgi:hypothetical protein
MEQLLPGSFGAGENSYIGFLSLGIAENTGMDL